MTICKRLPAAANLLDMIVLHLPFPVAAQKNRASDLYEGHADERYSKAIPACDPEGLMMLYIFKIVYTHQRQGPLLRFRMCFLWKGQKWRGANYMPAEEKDVFKVKIVQRTIIMMGERVG